MTPDPILENVLNMRGVGELCHGNMDTHGYFASRQLAVQELPKYRDWYRCYPPEPDDKHIVPIEVITEL